MSKAKKEKTKPVTMGDTYWGGNGQHQEAYGVLFSKLVPSNGEANTEHGDALRCVSAFYYDMYNNGGKNWGLLWDLGYADRIKKVYKRLRIKLPKWLLRRRATMPISPDSMAQLEGTVDKVLEICMDIEWFESLDRPLPVEDPDFEDLDLLNIGSETAGVLLMICTVISTSGSTVRNISILVKPMLTTVTINGQGFDSYREIGGILRQYTDSIAERTFDKDTSKWTISAGCRTETQSETYKKQRRGEDLNDHRDS